MLVYYCKKCKANSASPICEHCGAQINPQGQRFIWRYVRTPLGDTPTLVGAFKLIALTVTCLVLFLFLGELIFSSDKRSALTMLSASGILPWALILLAFCVTVVLLVLALQGREELHFVLESRGAFVQTWIAPSRLKCLARFIPYERYGISRDAEGNERMLIGQTNLQWQDVCRYEVRRHAGRIDLYRPSGFRFMSIYPEREEMEAVEDYCKRHMKQLAKQ